MDIGSVLVVTLEDFQSIESREVFDDQQRIV
jgi:hypothetical protein